MGAPGSAAIEVRTAALDLACDDVASKLEGITRDLEVGLVVYNAAYAPLGSFLDRPLDDSLRALDVNCRGPVVFAHVLGSAMARRGRGGLVLMSSLAGMQGTASIATYSATKSFNRVFGEALWWELREHGVCVIASCAGAIRTPGFEKAATSTAPGTLSADEVAERTLAALGRGPTVVPGALNTVAAFVMGRLLPKRLAIRLMASTTRKVVPAPSRPPPG